MQGVGSGRYLQIMQDAGWGGEHKGKSKAVSEQAKELWNWCQVRQTSPFPIKSVRGLSLCCSTENACKKGHWQQREG